MTGQELLDSLRSDYLDNSEPPYKWLDAELLRYLNYAEVQTCRRAHLLVDGITANDLGTAATATATGVKPLCVLVIVADQAYYTLSPKILQIKRCQLMSMTYPLTGPVAYSELDHYVSGWWGTVGTLGTSGTYSTSGTSGTVAASGTGGVPTYFLNEPGNTITFIKAPSTNDIASLVVSRIPLLPFVVGNSPEIPEAYHQGLLDWAAHLAFNKPGEETFNPNLSAIYERKFVQQFGELPNAYSEKMRRVLSQKQRMRPREFGS